MNIDYSAFLSTLAIVFPDFTFAALPRQANEVKESIVIRGSSTRTILNIQGTADQAE